MEELIKCNECGETFENKKIKANHVRWKHRDQTDYNAKSVERGNKIADKIHGKLITETVSCNKCDKDIEIEYRGNKKDKYFCSRSCANSRKASKEKNAKISNSLKQEPKVKSCPQCDKEYGTKKKDQIFCSNTCRGLSKRKDDGSLGYYRKLASFDFNLKDYPDKFDFELIKEHGFYSAANRGNNLNGVSRDHMYSVSEGYANGVDPNILGHPANCQLMRHNDNVSKNGKSSITLEALKNRILNWK